MSIALLMFSIDDSEGILRNIQDLESSVDEIVIVDSSASDVSSDLRRRVEAYGGKLYRAIPLGCADPLRPFGISKVQSEYVLVLDADEEASEPLKARLRSLRDRDAYVLPRFEEELQSYTYHLRVFRRTAIEYRGRSFDFPDVTGSMGWLDKTHRLIHHAQYQRYFLDKERAQRYFVVENIERPFTRRYLIDAMTVRFGNRSLSLLPSAPAKEKQATLLSPLSIRAAIEIAFLKDLALGHGIRAATFGRHYSQAKERFLRTLAERVREEVLAIALDLNDRGGLFPYLGLSDSSYLERLTDGFRWDLRGIDVYMNLLRYRYRHGRRAESVYAIEESPSSESLESTASGPTRREWSR